MSCQRKGKVIGCLINFILYVTILSKVTSSRTQPSDNNPLACDVCACDAHTVDCSSRELDDIISDGIPEDTVQLNISCNRITRLDVTNLKNLAVLDIDHNRIKRLDVTYLGNLVVLHAEHNGISEPFLLPSSLYSLYCAYNKLRNMFGMFNVSFNLHRIDLTGNSITSIPNGTFASCQNLKEIDMHGTQLVALTKRHLSGLPNNINQLWIGSYRLARIEPGTFNFTFKELRLGHGFLPNFPEGIFSAVDSRSFSIMHISELQISNISEFAFQGIREIGRLYISSNNLIHLPQHLFSNVSICHLLTLTNNLIEELPDRFLQSSPNLTVIILGHNRIRRISIETFRGLYALEELYLFQNEITSIPPMTFYDTSHLKQLYLFNNNIASISSTSFCMPNKTLVELHIYYNDLVHIADDAFNWLSDNAQVYLSSEYLFKWPKYSMDIDIFGVGDNINDSSLAYSGFVVQDLRNYGYSCSNKPAKCTPCPRGTYGNLQSNGCWNCPAGGYYQDKFGQVSKTKGGLGCKLCNNGTYVSPERTPGKDSTYCDVCPTGTDRNKFAGFRACPCLDGYYRKDRFGRCQRCPDEGVDCSGEYQKLISGFWWTWTFHQNETQSRLKSYMGFVDNILTLNSTYKSATIKFMSKLPKPYPCLRGKESCPVSGNGINDPCAEEYDGWLCSKCAPGYYSWFEYCERCPPLWHLILELMLVVIVIGIVFGAIALEFRRRDRTKRSIVDILLARFKIIIGYYQIAGAIFTTLHNVHWPQKVSKLASIFKALELNIFKLLAKPRCYIEQLQLNIYREFLIGVAFCFLVMIVPAIVYTCRYVYTILKPTSNPRLFAIQMKHMRSKCLMFVILVLFITYLSMCSCILGLMPAACQEFCIDEDAEFCVKRLRSDYSIDCEEPQHNVYSMAAYGALVYLVAYPICLLVLIYSSVSKKRGIPANVYDQNRQYSDSESVVTEESSVPYILDESDNDTAPLSSSSVLAFQTEDDNENAEEHEDIPSTTSSDDESPPELQLNIGNQFRDADLNPSHPVYIRFLCENYKSEYWYWEIAELSRKLLQTSLIVLYGAQDPLTLGATIVISMMFITLHAYCKPMKDQFEHWLQMLSLIAIFLNLLSAVILLIPFIDISGHRHTAMAVFIIGINVSVLILAIGNCVLIVWKSVRTHGRLSCRSCCAGFAEVLSPVTHFSRIIGRETENPAAI